MRTYKYYIYKSHKKLFATTLYPLTVCRQSTRFGIGGKFKYWDIFRDAWLGEADKSKNMVEITYDEFIAYPISKDRSYKKMLIEWKRIIDKK